MCIHRMRKIVHIYGLLFLIMHRLKLCGLYEYFIQSHVLDEVLYRGRKKNSGTVRRNKNPTTKVHIRFMNHHVVLNLKSNTEKRGLEADFIALRRLLSVNTFSKLRLR